MDIANLAIQSVLSPVVLVAGGLWVDNKYGTTPWGLSLGAIFGVGMSAILIRELTKRLKKNGNDDLES